MKRKNGLVNGIRDAQTVPPDDQKDSEGPEPIDVGTGSSSEHCLSYLGKRLQVKGNKRLEHYLYQYWIDHRDIPLVL